MRSGEEKQIFMLAEEIYQRQDLGESYDDLLKEFQEKVPYPNAAELFNGDQGPEYIANFAMNYQSVKPGDLSKESLIELVRKILDPEHYEEYEIDIKVQLLKEAVTDPKITDYIFWEGMTPEEAINKALSYKPIVP